MRLADGHLGAADPLADVLTEHKSKVYRFGAPDPEGAEQLAATLAHPTVEAVAELIARVVEDALRDLPSAPGARVAEVTVRETHVNSASWRSTEKDSS